MAQYDFKAFSIAARQSLKELSACTECVRIRNSAAGFSVETDCSQQEAQQLQQMQQQANSQWNRPGHPGWALASQDLDLQSTPSLPEVSISRQHTQRTQHTQHSMFGIRTAVASVKLSPSMPDILLTRVGPLPRDQALSTVRTPGVTLYLAIV